MTEAAIDSGFLRDVYISLGDPVEGGKPGAWGIRVYIKPCINWIWLGALMMAIGAMITLFDRRYRRGAAHA
jgi:cytochrome c-type biogenesis protein CcmF